MKPQEVRPLIIWILLNLLFLVVLAIPPIWGIIPNLYTWLVGARAQGILYIVKVCNETGDDGEILYDEIFLYKDAQGRLQESTAEGECDDIFTNAQTAGAWYLPNVPNMAVIDTDGIQFGYLIFLGFFLLCMGAPLFFFLRFARMLVQASITTHRYDHLLLATLGCLVVIAPLLAMLRFLPPPVGQVNNWPTHNFHLGQTVTTENLWAVTVDGGQIALIHAPDAGNLCLKLEITLRNLTDQQMAFDTDQFTLYDGQIKPRNRLCQADVPALGNATLAPGATIQATNFYEVPASMRQFYLSFWPNPQDDYDMRHYFWNIQATQSTGWLEQWQGQGI